MIYRYLHKPFKAGTCYEGAFGRVIALIDGGATARFDQHETRFATTDVKASPALYKTLTTPLSAVADEFGALKSKLTGRDTGSLDITNSDLAAISSTSAEDGASITESTNQTADNGLTGNSPPHKGAAGAAERIRHGTS